MPNVRLLLDHFTPIKTRGPSEIIVDQFRQAVETDMLRPGQKLPPERLLAERFGTGTGPVQEAMQRLRFCRLVSFEPPDRYHLLKAKKRTLLRMFAHLENLQPPSYPSLMEVRLALESASLRRLTASRGKLPLDGLKEAMALHAEAVEAGEGGEEEDALVHFALSEVDGDPTTGTVMGQLLPDLVRLGQEYNVFRGTRGAELVEEHRQLLSCLDERNPDGALDVLVRSTRNSINVYDTSQTREREIAEGR